MVPYGRLETLLADRIRRVYKREPTPAQDLLFKTIADHVWNCGGEVGDPYAMVTELLLLSSALGAVAAEINAGDWT